MVSATPLYQAVLVWAPPRCANRCSTDAPATAWSIGATCSAHPLLRSSSSSLTASNHLDNTQHRKNAAKAEARCNHEQSLTQSENTNDAAKAAERCNHKQSLTQPYNTTNAAKAPTRGTPQAIPHTTSRHKKCSEGRVTRHTTSNHSHTCAGRCGAYTKCITYI